MSKLPWRKWYPQDWLSDEQVGQTTPAARGLWAECLNVMLNKNAFKVEGEINSLARMLRFSVDEFKPALSDLRLTTVADVTVCNEPGKQNVTDYVTIVSRRLRIEHNERERIRLAVRSSRSRKACNNPSVTECNSASASESLSSSFGEGEGRGFVNGHPSLKEVLSKAEMVGLARWKAEDWFNEMEGCGWLDYNHRPVRDWCAVLTRVRTKWESDGRPMSPPKPKTEKKTVQNKI